MDNRTVHLAPELKKKIHSNPNGAPRTAPYVPVLALRH
jgi:hypothetical protein